ncbi:MAG: hypothetical protein L3J16_05685 [Anaerolineales bacterium]|nr:hypothetical protein [Anaerolineales bacterium]
MTFWQKLKPAASKKWLFLLAGLMWSGVGVFLNKLAIGWLIQASPKTNWLMAALGIALAFAIYNFGFSKLAQKNIRRVFTIPSERPCIFAFQQWTSYPLVAFMIALGIFLRIYSPIPKIYLATMYIGIGGSLFLASLLYYREIFQPQPREVLSVKPDPDF